MQGHHFQIDKEPLLAVPLCVPIEKEQEQIAKIVGRIIQCLRKSADASTDAAKGALQRHCEEIEEQLQDAVESLYGLDDSERQALLSK